MELYLSQIVGRNVTDQDGQSLGVLQDLVIRAGQTPPTTHGYVVKGKKGGLYWASAGTVDLKTDGLIIQNPAKSLRFYHPQENYILLAEDVLDKQVIDIQGRKVIRVNDIKLEWANGNFKVVAADVGFPGFLRRLGGRRLERLFVRLGLAGGERLIPWHFVEPLGSPTSPVKLNVAWHKLRKLHPADIAEIVDDLDHHEQIALFSHLDTDTVAEALAQIDDPEVVKTVLERLDPERAAAILERMSPDDAADLLGDLPKKQAEAYLGSMQEEERNDVRELLTYDERTAGGLMTTEYVELDENMTADQVIQLLRKIAPDAETVYYLYVVDSENHLVGVLSLRDLIVAPPDTRVKEIMTGPVISVRLEASQEEVVDVMARYDFLAIPVVDADNHLEGIITVDDVMDVALEKGGWKRQVRGRRW
ncbi:MAG TPA: magnesium transporter [Clostridia bacterium]|nr:magnesium transporter [Clostridia bacterium]